MTVKFVDEFSMIIHESLVYSPLGYIDVGDGYWRPDDIRQMCLWQVLNVDDRLRMLLIDLIHWKTTNIHVRILPKTSPISHHHNYIINITVTARCHLNPSNVISYRTFFNNDRKKINIENMMKSNFLILCRSVSILNMHDKKINIHPN